MSEDKCPECLHAHSGDCLTCTWRVADALRAERDAALDLLHECAARLYTFGGDDEDNRAFLKRVSQALGGKDGK